MINHSTLLNFNESEPSIPSAQSPSIPLLRSLQEILHNRIIQKKGEIHKAQNRAYTDNLWREIETLHWMLAQIITLMKREKNVTTPSVRATATQKNKRRRSILWCSGG